MTTAPDPQDLEQIAATLRQAAGALRRHLRVLDELADDVEAQQAALEAAAERLKGVVP